MLVHARTAGLPQPELCALISPTVDYGFSDRRIWHSRDPFLHPRFVVAMHKHYVNNHRTASPDPAPIDADLHGLAPLLILTAEYDLLRCETERLVEKGLAQGAAIEVIYWQHVWHGWHLLAPQLPEATRALRAFAAALRRYVVP